MSVETDTVLSAIRRGEDSLPKLRAATGLDYAQLHPVLYKLEFDWRSIQRSETADGFDRYTPTPSEKTNGGFKGVDWKDEHGLPVVPPAAFRQTKASLNARELALLQREAPYCAACRGLCFLVIQPDRQVQWKCPACKEVFDGSTQPVEMAHIEPEPEPKVSVMRDRDTLGPEEEAALQNMRDGIAKSEIGDEEEAVLDEMRGGELDENEARIAAEIDAELTEEDQPAETCVDCGGPRSLTSGQRCRPCYLKRADAKRDTPSPKPDLCGCGRPGSHGGRCSYRRKNSSSLADELSAERSNKGRPRIEVDLQALEDTLANADLTTTEVARHLGFHRNLFYERREEDPEFAAAYDRGMARREQAKKNGHRKSGENITETITGNGRNAHNVNIADNTGIARNPDIIEEPKTGNSLTGTLRQTVAEKEAQIAVLEGDIVALKRTILILER